MVRGDRCGQRKPVGVGNGASRKNGENIPGGQSEVLMLKQETWFGKDCERFKVIRTFSREIIHTKVDEGWLSLQSSAS